MILSVSCRSYARAVNANDWASSILMGQDLEISILAKVRGFLGVDDSVLPGQLYSLLRDYRIQVHPDKFQDEEQKKTAGRKFQEVQGLLVELMQFVQNHELTKTPSEIALFEPQIDRIYLMREVDCLKDEIESLRDKSKALVDEVESLKSDLDRERRQSSDLEAQLNDRAKESLKAEALDIENLYKPTLQTFAPAGVAVLVVTALSVMTKIEDVATLVRKYSPMDEMYLNASLFLVFLISLGLTVKNILESAILRRRAREIASPDFCEQFVAHLNTIRVIDPAKINSFTESEAFTFICGKARWWHKMMAACGFHAYQVETANRLTDYFLATLLTKKLIGVGDAELLNRSFIIKTRATRYMF